MQRQSNIELLRIVAMSFILIYHFIVHVLDISTSNPYVFQSLAIANICGVNLFVMISGYFGIKGSLKSFIKLFGLIVFISAVTLLIGALAFNMTLSPARIAKTFIMPFTVQYWFLACYLGLYVLAPLLNKGLSILNTQELRHLVIVLTFISVFSCWYGKNQIDTNGYSLFHFIYIYILGYFLHHGNLKVIASYKWILLCLISVSANIALTFAFDHYYNSFENRYWDENALSYNNPFIILASVSIFMWFANFNMLNSAAINALASAALGCYLLQDGFFSNEMYQLQSDYFLTHAIWESIIMFTISFIVYWLISYVLCKSYYFSYNIVHQFARTKMPVYRLNLFSRKN